MTIKSIVIDSLSVPDFLGYNDRGTILCDNAIVWHDSLSCCPNPYQPSTGKKYRMAYGWVAPCSATFECWSSPKHGKSLKLNDLGPVPARYPDLSNGAPKMTCSAVEIHCGQNHDWRGSAACITVDPGVWPSFIKFFEIGDKGQIAIIDKTGGVA